MLSARTQASERLHTRKLQSKGNKIFVMKMQHENKKMREEYAKVRKENNKREHLAFQREKLQIEVDLQRQTLLVEASSKDRENHVMALQNRDELAQIEKQRERELAKAEADPEMKLSLIHI